MTVYIDSQYRCHAQNAEHLRAVESEHFDNKCDAYINGYRFIPQGETWVSEDGRVFQGEIAYPIVPYDSIKPFQEQYEADQEELNTVLTAIESALGV